MKTIYKSIALEAALLSVTLALQAEIQSEGETVTADVQASTLDRLKVTLVSPNVSGARDLVASGNATIDGNEIAVNLENLTFGTHRLIVSARFGTQVRTLYALDISVPQEELPDETQEYEDEAIVVSTYGDGGGSEFPTDYARQGTNPDATLTDTQAYAQAAASDAAAAKTAAQSLTSLDSDINAGKTAIAQAVTAKGVSTSPTDTMIQMATNVTQIAQAPISINGGEMYAKQLYGSLTTPNYWNLYEVMTQLLSDGRLNNYGGILLAEYYKGYDSLALSGAGAGGAYVVSDVDSNGNFIMYTEDTTHAWGDDANGKGNRWVAYCFASDSHPYSITDTGLCPRSIHIGRRVGILDASIVDGRISEIVVTDGNLLDDFITSGRTQNWGKNIILRNITHSNGTMIYNAGSAESIYISASTLGGTLITSSGTTMQNLSSVIVDCDSFNGNVFSHSSNVNNGGCSSLIIKAKQCAGGVASSSAHYSLRLKQMQLYIDNGSLLFDLHSSFSAGSYTIYIGYTTNIKTDSVYLRYTNEPAAWGSAQKVEIQQGWCKGLDISPCINANTESDIYTGILQRLKQDEPDCGDGVTITLGQTNLDKLTSAESIALLDDLTNIYGYTFA